MSNGYGSMPPSSLRSFASAASRSIKGYVASRDPRRPTLVGTETGSEYEARPSWGQWAGQKLRQVQGETTPSVESISLFPGWATRRFHEAPDTRISLAGEWSCRVCSPELTKGLPVHQEAPFDVEVFVSGFASKTSGTGFNTRSGRAFLRIATCE